MEQEWAAYRFDYPLAKLFEMEAILWISFIERNFIFYFQFENLLLAAFDHHILSNVRSSHPEVFLGKGVLKICSKFTGEHPCRSVISINLQSNFIEITLRHGCSFVNLLHIFRIPFTKNTSGWLLRYTANAFVLPGKDCIDCFLLDTWLKGMWKAFIFFSELLVCFL